MKVLCFPFSNKEGWRVKVEARGWERSSPWALGRSLQLECPGRGLLSKRLRPRNQEEEARERPQVRKTSGTSAEASQPQARMQASRQGNKP